jgi:UDP-4-amino-4,6-dideoxy-N-acetyl-beta-L-altrosamine transaminase
LATLASLTESGLDTHEPLPYSRQWVDDSDIEAVVGTLRGDWLTQGPAVAAFERALAHYCGARFAVAVSSGTAALHLACLAARVGPGDWGITSPITFVASANCMAYCGGAPVFVDINSTTATLDPAALRAACQRRHPRVIVPVDFAGQCADLPAIAAIARECGALVIEDAAHALGAAYQHQGRWVRAGACVHSDMAVLSFHPVKHIATGEGGAVLTNAPEFHQRLRELRSHGITHDPERLSRSDGPWYYEQCALGYNYRLTDVQSALGLSQLRRLEAFVARRRELVELYRSLLADLDDRLTLLTESSGQRSSYHLMVIRLAGGSSERRALYDFLHRRGIRVQVHYIPVHLQPWYRDRFGMGPGDCPRAEAYYQGCLSLPLAPVLSGSDIHRVSAAIHDFMAYRR